MENKPLPSARDVMAESLTRTEVKRDRHEESMVLELLRCLKIPKEEKRRLYEQAQSVDRRRPILEDFMDTFPDFPVHLVASNQTNLRSTTSLGQMLLMKKATKMKFIRQYFETQDELSHVARPDNLAMLIQWPYVGTCVLHSQLPNVQDVGCRWVLSMRCGEEVQTLTLEPLRDFAVNLREYMFDNDFFG